MEYVSILERIDNVNDIEKISEIVCNNYKLGKYVKHKVVYVGYEDFNVILYTTSGIYFMKILNRCRTDEECERLAKIYDIARKNKVNVPGIYKNKNELVLKVDIKGTKLRIILMEYIEGNNMYELGRNLTLEEIEQVAYQAAIINKINFNVEPYYDEWTLTNFKNEYEKKHNLICNEDKEVVNRVYKEFINIDINNLPKAYIHGDIMNANLIKSKNKIWLIDFSVLNYLPRIIELVVIVYGICICKNREDSIKRLNYFLSKYNEKNKITKLELEYFTVLLNTMGAMSIMQSSYIKANHENFEENQYWLDKGKEVINLNLKTEEIKLIN